MIETILELLRNSDYDFRSYANPDDPLLDQFDDWRDYYRGKYAIARALQPRSILEIGVRYGYSARAFLDGAPKARYLGIDIDGTEYGGCGDDFAWARKITDGFDAAFLKADSQKMDRLPGGLFDLVHVDGQQDGDGTYWDLVRALKSSRWILLDGYYWVKENFDAANTFLRDRSTEIEFFAGIPGYAGELLIKTRRTGELSSEGQPAAKEQPAGDATSSLDIVDAYGESYYLQDCGGFGSFRATSGRHLLDPRLSTVFHLARIEAGNRVVDVGCGRGEITFAAAAAGADVDAVDYSADAIRLTRQCFREEDGAAGRVRFHQADAAAFRPAEPADRIVAADIIEHMAAPELDRLYANVASYLAKDGQFIIHTAPCAWMYRYGYARKRRQARAQGFYLSPEPRSHYERVMHINEQTPTVLRRQLSRHFPHVAVWLGTVQAPFDSLERPYRLADYREAVDVFAVASHSPIDLSLIRTGARQAPLPPEARRDVRFLPPAQPLGTRRRALFELPITVVNGSPSVLSSRFGAPVHMAYHWIDRDTGETVLYDGPRTPFARPLAPGERREVRIMIHPPARRGRFILRLSFVQESIAWFEWDDPGHALDLPIDFE